MSSRAIEKQATQRELEKYAQVYFKYSVLIQEKADAMAAMRMEHTPEEINAVHTRITAERVERQKHAPKCQSSLEELQNMLNYYGRLYENEPSNFARVELKNIKASIKKLLTGNIHSRVRITFYASYCAQLVGVVSCCKSYCFANHL